jgi:hypothetical protein
MDISDFRSMQIDTDRELHTLRDDLTAQRQLVGSLIDLLLLPSGSLAFSAKLKAILAERDRIQRNDDRVFEPQHNYTICNNN